MTSWLITLFLWDIRYKNIKTVVYNQVPFQVEKIE